MGFRSAYQALSNYLLHPGTVGALAAGATGGLLGGPPGAILAATGVNLLRNEIDRYILIEDEPPRLRRSGG